MKKEIIAGILLIAVFAAAVYNISVSNRYFSELEDEIRDVYELAGNDDHENACKNVELAIAHWENLAAYTRVFIGYADVDSVNNAIYSFRSDVYRADLDSLRGTYGYLISCLDNLMETENISFRSIF